MPINSNLKDLKPAREKYSKRVQLLSKGFANKAAFPDGFITIFPWDSLVDDFVATKLRKGSDQILYNILPKVCNLNGCKPHDFYASEALLILMVSRAILRNDRVTFTAECTNPKCLAKISEEIQIPGNLEKIGEKPEDYAGYDDFTLTDSSEAVRVRPIRIKDELDSLAREPHLKSLIPDHVARALSGVVSIGGGTPDNALELATWFLALSPADQTEFLEKFDKNQPQLSTICRVSCNDCGKEFEYQLQLDQDFFRGTSLSSDRGAVEDPVRPSVQNQGSGPRPTKGAGAGTAKNA